MRVSVPTVAGATAQPSVSLRTRKLTAAGMIVGGSLVLTVSAKLQVPFWPVPMTMQSLAVLLIGLAFGSRLGAVTVLAYLAEGFAGLPVFAGSAAGPAYMAGPTGGYLLGFLAAAAVAGWLGEHGWGRGAARLAAIFTLGHVALFAPGVLWLAVLFGGSKAVALGIAPFVYATVLKIALGVALVSAAASLRARRPELS